MSKDGMHAVNITKVTTVEDDIPKYFRFHTSLGNVGGSVDTKVMISTSSDLSYEPYTGGQPSPSPEFPQSVKVVEGYRNLFDGQYYQTYTSGSSPYEYASSSAVRSGIIKVQPNTTYTISKEISNRFRISQYTEYPVVNSSNAILYIYPPNESTRTSYTLKTESTTQYLVIQVTNENQENVKMQVIEGTEEKPYVPYGNNYIAVNVSDGNTTNSYPIPLNDNEIVGIGNYLDELIVDKSGHVFINKKTGKVVFNGSETKWEYRSSSVFPYRYPITNKRITSNWTYSLLCNYYKAQSESYNYAIAEVANSVQIGIRNVDITSLANFKAWLSTHNTEVYYVRETPQLIDLNTTVDLKLFKGVNNITNSEDGNMRIRYVESIESIINNFDERLKALEEANS